MPSITMFISAQAWPTDEALERLSAQCAALCTEILFAAVENVHVIYVTVHHGRGRPIFVEFKYRLEPFRTQAVVDDFIDKLDSAIVSCTGTVARIRGFGYSRDAIQARH